MNRKGFAVSGILYTILLIFLAIIYMLLMNFKNKKNLLDQLKNEVLFSTKLCEERVGQTFTFDYTGDVQKFITECDGDYKIELWGAQGGSYESNHTGELGGYTAGKINLSAGDILFVYVGEGEGGINQSAFNSTTSATAGGTPGGGATDVRIISGNWNSDESLRSRIMVAAGGGSSQGGKWGGEAGGLIGYSSSRGTYTNTGGTQVSGGVYSTDSIEACGGFGIGSTIGATGGSGWYGGSGAWHSTGSGAGGSSYISGYTGCVGVTSKTDSSPKPGCTNGTRNNECSISPYEYIFTNGVMIDGKGCNWETGTATNCGANQPQPNGTSAVGHAGNGYAKITYLGKNEQTCNVAIGTGYTYNYTGNAQAFTAPCKGYYRVELWGAQGAGASTTYTTAAGANGGYTAGSISLNKNDNLYVYVGSQPSSAERNIKTFNGGTSNSGGWNGGGATDIRLINGEWDSFNSLKSRIMVAAGGGSISTGSATGAAGGLIGYASTVTGGTSGGTQTASAAAASTSYTASTFGVANGGCSGGNGYYAGGGAACAYGSGGGSSFISGHNGSNAISEASTENSIIHTGQAIHYSGYRFIYTKMIDGNGYEWTTTKAPISVGMPTHDGKSTMIGNTGNGYAKITYLGDCPLAVGEGITYNYASTSQEFTAACTGKYKVELWGAQGYKSSGGEGGKGGYVSGSIRLEKNTSLYLYVGNQGTDTVSAWNGAGVCHQNGTNYCGTSGGGGTDIRVVSGAWDNAESLRSRIMVAGSGGGAGGRNGSAQYYSPPGVGGGLTGSSSGTYSSYLPSTGGSQTAGGYSHANSAYVTDSYGSFGMGPQTDDKSCCGASGGSGWYGGGGGCGNSAGGGSAYISGHTGCVGVTSRSSSEPKSDCTTGTTTRSCSISPYGYVFNDTQMIDGAGCKWTNQKTSDCSGQPQPNGTVTTGHSGSGYAKITYLGNN